MDVTAAPVCYRHTNRESHIRCQRCARPICPDCMNSAAVGFHCPECVREGQRSVRSGRPLSLTARGVPAVTYALIGINVAVWVAIMAWPALVDVLAMHAANYCTFGNRYIPDQPSALCAAAGGTYAPGTSGGAWWQLVTSMFAHQQVWHIAANMFSLWMIGPMVELAIGRWRYLAAYLACGLAGSLLVLATESHFAETLGASGAIFGLLGILVVMFLRRGLPLQQLGTVVLLNFFITFTVSGISWQAHVGGFVAGLAIGSLIAYTPLGRRI